MRIYRTKFRDRTTGETKLSPYFSVDFVDHRKQRQRLSTAIDDQKDAGRFADNLAELVKARRRDVLPTDKVADWLRDLSIAQQEKLIDLDLARPEWCSSLAATTESDLQRHVADFETWLTSSKARHGFARNPEHIRRTVQRVEDIIQGCGFRFWADIKRAAVESYLGTLRKKPRKKGQLRTETAPVSIRTLNGYLAGFKQFVGWVVEDGRAESSPILSMKRLKGEGEKRRALGFDEEHDLDEVQRLIECTSKAPERRGMTGYDRAVLYLVGLATGFRANELRHLTVGSFDLRRSNVRLEARFCKDRNDAVQAIPYRLREKLAEYFKGREPSEQAFNIGPWCRTCDMIREDAAEAGIRLKDDKGQVLTFHSLRHTLRTTLVTVGVPEAVIDAICRHKPQGVGRRVYTHVEDIQIRAAIEKLPEWPWPAKVGQQKVEVA